jgi:asparagine synthase (glutamine-hydrolysing)
MCGIAGLLPTPNGKLDVSMLSAMCRAIAHRGPDDWGVAMGSPGPVSSPGGADAAHVTCFTSHTRVGLANTRLSIIDLSAAGHQPMSSADGQVWIVYNGELYNFVELRNELQNKGHRFRSGTDTEVILRLFEVEGTSSFSRLNGMFAFAIWDNRCQTLFLARDRFGVKPLYYGRGPEGFAFRRAAGCAFRRVPASRNCTGSGSPHSSEDRRACPNRMPSTRYGSSSPTRSCARPSVTFQ